MEFEPVYQVCGAVAMNQRSNRVVGHWLCHALAAAGGGLRVTYGVAGEEGMGREGDRAAEQARTLKGKASLQ